MNWLLVFYIIGCIISLGVNLYVFNVKFPENQMKLNIKIRMTLILTLLSWIYIIPDVFYKISRLIKK